MENDSTIYGAPVHLEFYDQENETENKEFSISVIRESNGPSRQEAYRLADNIRYNYSMNGNILTLDPVFKTSKNDLYRGQEVTIRVYVPHGKSVQFGSNIGRINWHDDFEGRTMKMTEEGWVNASSSK